MRKIIFGLIILLLGAHLLSSCNSSNNSLSQFSKRKYLKKYKPSKRVKNDVINDYSAKQKEESRSLFASQETKPEYFVLDEIEAFDSSIVTDLNGEFSKQIIPIKQEPNKDFETNKASTKPFEYFLKHFNTKLDTSVEENREKKSVEREALISLLFGILGIPSFFLLFGSLLAIILGIKSLSKIKRNPERYSEATAKKAKTGIALGIIGLVLFTFLIFVAIGSGSVADIISDI